MKMLRELDPVGTETRRACWLRRRQYVVVGPNFCWHDSHENFCALKFQEPTVTQ